MADDVPPHKSQSNDSSPPWPDPQSLARMFDKNLSLRNSKSKQPKDKIISYADNVVSLWFPVTSGDDTDIFDIFSSVDLKDFKVALDSRNKPLVLVNSRQLEKAAENDDKRGEPWVFIAQNVHKSVLSINEILRNDMTDITEIQRERVKLTLVARIGKILFRSRSPDLYRRVREGPLSKSTLEGFMRTFYSNVSAPYVDDVLARIEALGFRFEGVKDMYQIKVSFNTISDKGQTGATIDCRCRVKEDKTLNFYKAELPSVRQLVVDLSCLDKSSDLRLMSSKKSVLTYLTEEEMWGIIEVVDAAVIDQNVKGGLRWPSSMKEHGDKYTVCEVSHTTSSYYSCPSLILKIRDADRYDVSNDKGDTSKEATFKFKGLTSKLKEEKVDETLVFEMLKDNLKLIWNHFL